MTDLLADVAVLLVQTSVLERLAEHRVERLSDAADRGRVVGHGKGGDVGDAKDRVLRLSRSIEALAELHVLGHALKHARRLVEVDREADPGEVLANRALEDRPERDGRSVVACDRQLSAQIAIGFKRLDRRFLRLHPPRDGLRFCDRRLDSHRHDAGLDSLEELIGVVV